MKQKSILITGCSSGIGLTAALALKERGYLVFASARKPADVKKLQELGLESVELDVNDDKSINRALSLVLEKTGGTLDALFNNAGFVMPGAIEDLTRKNHLDQFETNVFGVMELIRFVLPIMRKQKHGRIIQNSSMLGYMTMPYYGAYTASKHALEGYSNTLRQELRGTNIHVSIINPGPIKTDLRKNAFHHYEVGIKRHQTGLYKREYEKLEQVYFNPEAPNVALSLGPKSVVKYLTHALESKRPKAHYYVGMPAKLFAFLKRILPDRALDSIVAIIR